MLPDISFRHIVVAIVFGLSLAFAFFTTTDTGMISFHFVDQTVTFSRHPATVKCEDNPATLLSTKANATHEPKSSSSSRTSSPSSTIPSSSKSPPGSLSSLGSTVDEFEWVDVSTSEFEALVTKEELLSIPMNSDQPGICNTGKMAQACCLGTLSAGGGNRRFPMACYGGIKATKQIYAQRFPIPYHRVFRLKGREVLFDMKDVMLAARDKTVVFLGDSVMNQIFDGLLCGIQRRTGAVLRIVTYERGRKRWYYGAGLRSVLKVDTTNTTLVLHREFRFHPSGLTVKEACHGADILVVNFGLHWNNMQQYSKDMKTLAVFLKQHCSGTEIIYRGSTSQHFFSENGRFSNDAVIEQQIKQRLGPEYAKNFTDGGSKGFRTGCVKPKKRPEQTRDDIAAASFRGSNMTVIDVSKHSIDELKALREASEFPTISFIPLGKITQNLYEFHYRECTHFCSTPLLWQPIAHYLYKAIGTEYKKNCSQLFNPKPWKVKMANGGDFQLPELAMKNSSIYNNRRRRSQIRRMRRRRRRLHVEDRRFGSV